MGIYAHWNGSPFINLLLGLGGGMNGKNFYFTRGMVISLISTIIAITMYICNSRPVFGWILGACKAEEIFQEFIEYLSHSQMLDWTNRMRIRRELLLRNCSKKY